MTDTARVTEMIEKIRNARRDLETRYPKNSYRFITVGRASENPGAILVTTGRDIPSHRQDIIRVMVASGLRVENCEFRWNHSGSITLTSF